MIETDEALYARVQAGDLAAFEILYARYERRLFSFILRLIDNRAEAEEVLHDAFVKVFVTRGIRFEEARFAAWLFRVARNLSANRLRSRSRGIAALTLLQEPAAHGPSPEEGAEREERASALLAAVRRLPQTLAEVFQLRTSGLSYEEVADVLGIPIGTVKSRMNALVTQLKGELQHDLL